MYTLTPRMYLTGLGQYNSRSHSLSSNFRLRWEYSPGSELVVAYTDDRDTDSPQPNRFSELRSRALVAKVTRLLRF